MEKIRKRDLHARLLRVERELSDSREGILLLRERLRELREFISQHHELPPEPSDYALLRRIDGGGGV